MTDIDTRHKKFQKNLRDSEQTRCFFAKWAERHGYETYLPKMTTARNFNDRHRHKDRGDVYIRGWQFNRWVRFEVKRRSFHFTSAGDWPYSSGAIVCNKNSFDRAQPPIVMFVHFNQDLSYAGFIHVPDTFERWTVSTVADGRYENWTEDVYMMPVWCYRFRDMGE